MFEALGHISTAPSPLVEAFERARRSFTGFRTSPTLDDGGLIGRTLQRRIAAWRRMAERGTAVEMHHFPTGGFAVALGRGEDDVPTASSPFRRRSRHPADRTAMSARLFLSAPAPWPGAGDRDRSKCRIMSSETPRARTGLVRIGHIGAIEHREDPGFSVSAAVTRPRCSFGQRNLRPAVRFASTTRRASATVQKGAGCLSFDS